MGVGRCRLKAQRFFCCAYVEPAARQRSRLEVLETIRGLIGGHFGFPKILYKMNFFQTSLPCHSFKPEDVVFCVFVVPSVRPKSNDINTAYSSAPIPGTIK